MKKMKLLYIVIFISFITLILSLFLFDKNNKIDIEKVLVSKEYSYLPLEAQNYVKKVYEETGKIILTEKNKEEKALYLNPQYVEYLTYSEEEKSNLGEIPISMIIDYSVREEAKEINVSSNYDLRNVNGKNYLTPVRNQGNLGICWAFATAGAAESYLLKTTDTSYQESTSTLISERQIDYVTSRNGIKDYKNEYVSFVNRSLGDGGNFYISTIAMANGVSLIDYNSFKEYDDTDLQKMELSDVISYSNSEYEVDSTIIVPRISLRESTSLLTEEETETRNSYLNEVKQNIMENGAAYVSTYMDSSCRYTDANLSNVVIDVYNCNVLGGHAMEIIGWNDDLEYSYCADTATHSSNISSCNRIISGKGVWILKNSWGTSLQYPYLTYDSLYTSISFIDEMDSAANKSWDNNYILGEEYENVNEKTYYLTDTKIKNDEKIEKIKFIAENPDTVYNVKVYKKDGTFETFSKTTNLPGLITIDISENIIVNKDTRIIINSVGGYIDKISVFTTNIDTNPYINLDEYDGMDISDSEIRLYSETKNISSGTLLTYKLYDSDDQEVINKTTFTNNIVAENNINTLVKFSNDLDSGTYRIDTFYNSNVISSIDINIIKMQGLGTENNPYIITNSTQLDQIRDDLDGYYELGNDIDLTEDTREGGELSLPSEACPQGFGWESINGFTGSLDGKGYSIKGLYQNNYLTCNEEKQTRYEWNNNGNGLFGSTSGNVTIKNLVLEDFDVNCQGNECSALLSKYNANNGNNSDTTEYSATFENIVLKNSEVSGIYNSSNSNSSLRHSYGGGLFGSFTSLYGNISISNIYLDFKLVPDGLSETAFLLHYIASKNVIVKNIHLAGNINGKYTDGSGNAVLIYQVYSGDSVSAKNILSTVTGSNVGGTLFNQPFSGLIIDGVNALRIEARALCKSNCTNATNVNLFDKNTELIELTDRSNYATWTDFDSNWIIRTINGIPRIPVLKFVDFEYTNIPNIVIGQKLNEHKNIYDYIMPQIEAAKRIIYKSNNENIVKVDENGIIIPQASGNTTIHIESFYDGYIKDVPISITYVPHYDIYFDANGGTGTMDGIEVSVENDYTLPKNTFTKKYYEFKEWNTKADGTGTSYDDLDQIYAMEDNESITLYAQWMGEERIVTFNPNGGIVNPERKTVRMYEKYGELPIPTKSGYGFDGWWYQPDPSIFLDISAHTTLNGYELIALWAANAYTIIYDANSGKIKSNYVDDNEVEFMSDTLATTYAVNASTKEISANLYEKTGYQFKEWNTKADGTGTSYVENQALQLSDVANDTFRLYAIWESIMGNITYNSNDVRNQTATGTYTLNVAINLAKNTFLREGYQFKEWNTKADGTGTSYTDEQSITISNNLILYAQWEEEFDYIINKYSYYKNNNYIDLIDINTTTNDFKSNIILNTAYTIDVEYKTINNKNVLYTGSKTKIFRNLAPYIEFTNIVRGDVNGNGQIDIIDYIRIKKDIMDIEKLKNEYQKAADMNNNNSIDIIDYIRIKKIIMEVN